MKQTILAVRLQAIVQNEDETEPREVTLIFRDPVRDLPHATIEKILEYALPEIHDSKAK